MSLLLALLVGCGGLPATIPNQPGAATAENATTIMAAASPDMPYAVYATVRGLTQEQYRSCPEITVSNDTTLIKTPSEGCVDSSGIQWSGSASYTLSGDTESLSLNNFSASGVTGGWLAKGSQSAYPPSDFSGTFLTSKILVTSLDAPTLDYWVDTTVAYTSDGSDYLYADNWRGTIGVQDIGTFDVVGARTQLAYFSGCDYGAAAFGDIAVQGTADSRLDISYHTFDATSNVRPPYKGETADTADTGFPVDTSDTGDSGDTAETGDTGETADTSDSSDTTDTSSGADEDSLCGCATVMVGGATVSECAVPARTVAWPFVAVYTE